MHCTPIEHLIIGAGPTGLGAATQLQKLGRTSWRLLEAEPRPGGLARSFIDENGFTWDIGGHVQFSHYDLFDDAMVEYLGSDGWNHLERESWVWMKGRFIPYPLQNNIHRLPPDELNACLQGLVDIMRNPRPPPQNFGEWIEATFGPGLADVFMRAYNFKVWAYAPEMMNASWVGERVAMTDLARVLRNLVYGRDEKSWGPNNRFQFPKRGGTGAIWKACAARLPHEQISFSTKVVGIDLNEHIARTAQGEEIRYQTLISTMPLRELISIARRDDLQPLAERGLLFSSSNIIGIGLSGRPPEDLATKCWMYFPEEDCPFYRVTVFSNYARDNVPNPGETWSLMCEVAQSPMKPLQRHDLVEHVVDGLINTGLASNREKVVSKWHYFAKYGYPIPGLHRDQALSEIIPELDRFDVYSRGRFGMWKYEVSNQDHSFMQGVEIVERLVNDREEITAFDADYVNSKKHAWPLAPRTPHRRVDLLEQ